MLDLGVTNSEATPRSQLLHRPVEVFNSLPIEQRWEFTRRHPYYLQFWAAAARHHEQPSDNPLQRSMDEAASLILTSINVSTSMAPPDPRSGVEALGIGELASVWRGGAIAPATMRTLAQWLLLVLPAAQRSQIGRLLNESAEFESQDSEQMLGIRTRLAKFPEEVWNQCPDAPIISINLQMPQRAIAEALEQLVRQWKLDRGIEETRRRDDKLDEYLRVWDLREGWTGGGYDQSSELTFPQIARDTRQGIATLTSRYRSAFQFLTGHDYTPELWIRLMGPLKLSRFGGGQAGEGLIMRRPWRSPNLRPVTEAVLLPGRSEFEGAAFLAMAGVSQSDIAWVDQSLDIQTLIDQGRSDAEIIEELELDLPDAIDLISAIRQRQLSR